MGKFEISANLKKLIVDKRLMLTGIVLIIMFVVYSFVGNDKNKVIEEKVPFVKTIIVSDKLEGEEYSYPGEVRGRYEKELAFQVSGKVIGRYVQSGSVVKKGDELLAIDAKDIAQANNIALAQVNAANSQLNLADTNLKRYQTLYAQNAVSKAQLDQFENTYSVALASRAQAVAQYEQSSNQLDYTHLVADEAGVITNVSAEVGQVLVAGQTVISFVQEGEREVVISIPENRIDEFREESTNGLEVTFWALPEVRIKGEIREIAPMASKETRTYTAKIRLLELPPAIKLGMTAKVNLAKNTTESTMAIIPASALYQTGKVPGVWVVENNKTHLQEIEVVHTGNDYVTVKGLEKGTRIIAAGVHKLQPNQEVRLLDGE